MNYMINEEIYNRLKISSLVFVLSLFYFVPIVAEGKECIFKRGWGSGPVAMMVQECFKNLNASSIQEFGAPVIPALGINQCSCVVDEMRIAYECQEDYMTFTNESPKNSYNFISELSKKCIMNGAMGPKVREELLRQLDNETTSNTKEPVIEESKTTKSTPSWSDLINK